MTIDLVADTNIIYSALIKRGKIRSIILGYGNLKLHVPAELREELHRHAGKLQKYLGMTVEEIHRVIDEFMGEVASLHRREECSHLLEEAIKLAGEVDPYDAPFIALAMHLGVPLWTGDKGLIRLAVRTGFRKFKATDTQGVEMLLEGKPWSMVEEYLREKYG